MLALLPLLLTAGLEVTVTGCTTDTGKVRIAVFATEAGFPEDDAKAARRLELPVVKGTATAKFDDLPDGTYSVVAFHDLDGDGKLKKGAFGIPQEPWGVSKNARGTFGPDFTATNIKAPGKVTVEVK